MISLILLVTPIGAAADVQKGKVMIHTTNRRLIEDNIEYNGGKRRFMYEKYVELGVKHGHHNDNKDERRKYWGEWKNEHATLLPKLRKYLNYVEVADRMHELIINSDKSSSEQDELMALEKISDKQIRKVIKVTQFVFIRLRNARVLADRYGEVHCCFCQKHISMRRYKEIKLKGEFKHLTRCHRAFNDAFYLPLRKKTEEYIFGSRQECEATETLYWMGYWVHRYNLKKLMEKGDEYRQQRDEYEKSQENTCYNWMMCIGRIFRFVASKPEEPQRPIWKDENLDTKINNRRNRKENVVGYANGALDYYCKKYPKASKRDVRMRQPWNKARKFVNHLVLHLADREMVWFKSDLEQEYDSEA